MNAPFTFICGLIWMAVAIDLQARGVSALAVVGAFFFSLYWLIPVTFLQLPDDAALLKAFRRGKVDR